ncbi:MAG TPA: hypothetical protein VD768_05190 [Sphingomicrobium sp.]|nr:hypothetical protein [Sphingomicrobium sp.]
MKTEPKAFASLSSGLLARKGAARPAMRPQGFGQGGSSLEDLGWNDMGFEPPKPAAVPPRDENHDAFSDDVSELHARPSLTGLTPVESPVHGQQAEIAGRLSAYTPDDAGEEEEADETAELYEAEEESFESAPPAVVIAPVAPVAPVAKVAPATRRARAPRSAAGSKSKAAFTLRLDRERHLKLRLAAAVSGQSAQMLVTHALDQLLAAMPELDAMAHKAKPKG